MNLTKGLRQLSRGDLLFALAYQTLAVGLCLWLLVQWRVASDWREHWQDLAVGLGLVFALLQALFFLAIKIISHGRRLKEVDAKTAPPEAVPGSKSGSDVAQGLVWLLVFTMLFSVGGHAAVWLFPSSHWANHWRYALDNDLSGATFMIDKVPHDCEFFSAPMGSKHCHYEKHVATIRIDKGASGRIVSYDERRTWRKADPSDKAAVFVSWPKVSD